jgi:photosystem II stability/assembly factor-like uncharacterized protein
VYHLGGFRCGVVLKAARCDSGAKEMVPMGSDSHVTNRMGRSILLRRVRFTTASMLMIAGLMTATLASVAGPGSSPAAASGAPGSWQTEKTYQSTIDILDAVSCPSPSVCTAVGSTAAGGSPGVIVNSTDGGATWTTQKLPAGLGTLSSVSCASTSVCEALGYSNTPSANFAVGTTNGGATWQSQTLPSGLVGASWISCPSTSECIAVGQTSPGAMIFGTTDGGATWVTQAAPAGLLDLLSVACPSVTTCIAVGDTTGGASAIVTTSDGGTTWQTQTTQTAPLGPLSSIACPSTTVCTAVGTTSIYHGSPAIVSTSDGGTTWTTEQVPIGVFGLGGGLSDIACAYPAACTAVGAATLNGPGVVIATNNAGSTWATESAPTAFDFVGIGVSCPFVGACTAVGETSASHGIIIGQAPITAVLIPSGGTTVSGLQLLDATASSPVGISSVNFEITGGTLTDQVISGSTPTIYGWLAQWNTTTVPNGTYKLQSVATDTVPNTVTSAPITIIVNNQPPTTSILIPSSGATLSGSKYLDASASLASSVEFRLFGGIYGYSGPVLCTATPTYYGWLCSWNSSTVPNGSYALVSEAFNSTGSAFSSGVGVTVKN